MTDRREIYAAMLARWVLQGRLRLDFGVGVVEEKGSVVVFVMLIVLFNLGQLHAFRGNPISMLAIASHSFRWKDSLSQCLDA